jgi:hypothetical protein
VDGVSRDISDKIIADSVALPLERNLPTRRQKNKAQPLLRTSISTAFWDNLSTIDFMKRAEFPPLNFYLKTRGIREAVELLVCALIDIPIFPQFVTGRRGEDGLSGLSTEIYETCVLDFPLPELVTGTNTSELVLSP